MPNQFCQICNLHSVTIRFNILCFYYVIAYFKLQYVSGVILKYLQTEGRLCGRPRTVEIIYIMFNLGKTLGIKRKCSSGELWWNYDVRLEYDEWLEIMSRQQRQQRLDQIWTIMKK